MDNSDVGDLSLIDKKESHFLHGVYIFLLVKFLKVSCDRKVTPSEYMLKRNTIERVPVVIISISTQKLNIFLEAQPPNTQVCPSPCLPACLSACSS